MCAGLWLLAAVVGAEEPGRPVMREMPPRAFDGPPSQRDLVDARAELKRRFGAPLARANSVAGANHAAELLVDAAVTEKDRSLKWLLLAEARRLAVAAGNALVVDQTVVLASVSFDFDEIATELTALREIPLRGLDRPRATGVAQVAERLATRAEGDDRLDEAREAQMVAVRAWQRAGDKSAAARAAERHDALAAAGARKP